MGEVIGIGFRADEFKRVQSATQFLEIPTEFVSSSSNLLDRAQELQPRFLILSTLQIAAKEAIAGEVQVLRQIFPDTFILVVVEKKMAPSDAVFVKKSGCNFVLLEHEFFNTIRLEYVLLQVVKAAYIPVKVSDFQVGAMIDFSVYSVMPLNKKILPVLQKGTAVSQSRLDKLKAVGELYVKRSDMESFANHLKAGHNSSSNDLLSRCRAQYHSVAHNHANLVFVLTDQAEMTSYEAGKALLSKCSELARDFLTTLAVVPEPWNVLDQSILGMTGGPDRAMIIAAMAALSSLKIQKGVPEDVMMAGLFCDMGLLDLSPSAIGKIDSTEGRSKLSLEDEVVYRKHPILSVNRLLERKVQIPDHLKEIILCTHEQSDKKGFPKQVLPDRIPIESSLILFHEKIDLKYRVQFGKARVSYAEVKKQVFDQEYKDLQSFNLVFLETIRRKDLAPSNRV